MNRVQGRHRMEKEQCFQDGSRHSWCENTLVAERKAETRAAANAGFQHARRLRVETGAWGVCVCNGCMTDVHVGSMSGVYMHQ